ncbi:PIN/TRAM domain-containing protein [Candidatus Avelusimicrobium luingense]|uniref:PIN/TRAM domain-containing protein n=1 Tax=Candidatus Avelusimicrobium luingense TaxID=3416211 RepID=UPI003D10F050
MPIWIFRIATLVAFPFLTYTFIKQDWMTLLGGLLCGAIVVAGEVLFKRLRLIKIMIACTGLLMGYMLFVLINNVVILVEHQDAINWWNTYSFKAEIVLLVFGVLASIWKSRDLEGLSYKGQHLKVVDLSALLDGRVIDLCEIGFLPGIMVLPVFVLDELNKMAASNDPLERARGRRGLDISTRLQELKGVTVRLTNKNVKAATPEERIVKLAKSLDAQVVTLDFNISKAALLYNVTALNIADLTTALKPVVLPGETMSLFVMKEGKEKEQGIGYLDDGTMVVVEEGRKSIGKRIEVSVYSILQTSSGRMIFAKVK